MKLNRSLIGALLVSSIVFPAALPELKFLLFGGALFFSLAEKIKISKSIFLISIFFGLVGLAYSVYGFLVGAPGALRVLTVMVAYPLLFPLLASVYKASDAGSLFKIFLLASWLLVAVNLLYLVSGLVWPDNYFVSYIKFIYEDYAVIDSNEDYFKYTIPNISSLVFLLPFCISAFFMVDHKRKKVELFCLVLVMLVLTVLSGRRALFVAAFAGPLALYILILAMGRRVKASQMSLGRVLYVIAFLGFAGAFLYFFEFWDFYYSQVGSIFDFSGSASNVERALQFKYLSEGIVEKPFFGHGAGAAAAYSRSFEQPWAYELSYVAFLFQYGIFGFLIYASGLALLFYTLCLSLRGKERSIFECCFIAGFVAFLVANATNPYLAKFDYMWVIFIPLGVLSAQIKGGAGSLRNYLIKS